MIKRVGVLFHPKRQNAQVVAGQTAEILDRCGVTSSLLPATEEEAIRAALPEWELVITCGGDGTILRATRLAAPFGIPQLGINLGRLGFLAELQPEEIAERLPRFLHGEYCVEERAMLRARRVPAQSTPQRDGRPGADELHALNEVLVARGALPRVIRIGVSIDGVEYCRYGGDGVIVATATGSTAYSMAAGGPVLSPVLRNLIVTPICTHISRAVPLVLPPAAVVTLDVSANYPAVLSIDGQVDVALEDGDQVQVTLSPYTARFARARPANHFYELIGCLVR